MGRIKLVLDLDNTLINSITFKELVLLPKSFKSSKSSKNDRNDKNNKISHIDMDKIYRVFSRPYLQKFLDFIFAHFDVSIWTAASKEYASFIMDKIIAPAGSGRRIEYIFFAYHCKTSKKYLRCTKDLELLWRDLKLVGFSPNNTYIIDDLPEIYDTMPKHVFQAKYFDVLEEGAEDDRYLLNMIDKLKQLL